MVELVQEPKKTSTPLVRWMVIIAGIILIIVTIILKANVEGFSLKVFIFVIIGIIAAAIGIIVLFNYVQKLRLKAQQLDDHQRKLPPAVSLEQAREIAVKATQNPTYADYISNCLGERVQQMGKGVKSNIYTYVAQGKYEKQTYVVIINMHYPNQMRTILIDPKIEEIHRAEMLLANYPEDEPQIRETTIENPLLGTRQTTREVMKEKEPETKPEEPNKDM